MLQNISVYNFKCLHRAENLSLGKVTLLTGVNGRGKSSLLQALLVLSQTWRQSKYDVLLPNDSNLVNLGSYNNIHDITAPDELMRIRLITDDNENNDFEVAYKQSQSRPDIGELAYFSTGGETPMEEEEEEEDATEEYDSGRPETNPTAPAATPMLSTISDHPTLMALKNIYYVAANRQPATDRYKPDDGTGLFTLRPDGSNVLEAMDMLGTENLVCLKNMLKTVFGNGSLKISKTEDNSIILKLDSNDSENPLFAPSNVGYGYSYILTMLTSLLMMKSNDTLIIENPEAHLHPGAQSEVMRILIDEAVKRSIQILIETHSDHIINGSLVQVRQRDDFTADDLHVLFFSKDNVMNLKITDKGHILNPPKDFCDQYARDLDILYPMDEWQQ